MFLDTNVASQSCDSRLGSEGREVWISSVVASELLGVYDNRPTSARYYVPLPARIGKLEAETGMTHVGSIASLRRRDHPFGKRMTDSIVMEFGTFHRPIVEFGSQALCEVINERRAGLFTSAIQHLPKARRKAALRRFAWLLDTNATCFSITDEVLTTAYSLLRLFARSYTFKDNFRNTWNDMLIGATAIVQRAVLLSEDNLLNRFIATASRAAIDSPTGSEILRTDYSSTDREPTAPRRHRDAFHRPWQHRLAGAKWTRCR